MTEVSFTIRKTAGGSALRDTASDSALRADFTTQLPLIEDGTALQVEHLDYTSVNVFIGDPVGIDWASLVVVRSGTGAPITLQDGLQLVAYTTLPTSPFTDTGLRAGWYYYTLFAQVIGNSPPYVPVASAEILVPTNWDNAELMYTKLPEYYRYRDVVDADETLAKAFQVLGFDQDITQSYSEELRRVRDPGSVAASLLPFFGNLLGVPYEPMLGDTRYRSLLRNIVHLRQIRGTVPGITGFVEALTGCEGRVTTGVNRMLSADDAEAAVTIGTAVPMAGLDTPVTPSLVFWRLERIVGAAYVGTTYIRMIVNAGQLPVGTQRMGIGWGHNNPVLYGVPVIPATSYTFSAALRAEIRNTQPVRMYIDFYNALGVYISSGPAGGAEAVTTTGAWSPRSVTATSPAGAAYACPRVIGNTLLADTDSQLVSGLQFQQGVGTAYESPRRLLIDIESQRVNFALNPSMVGTSNWTAGAFTTIAASANVMTLTRTAGTGDGVSMISNAFPVIPGELYTAQIDQSTDKAGATFRLDMRWQITPTDSVPISFTVGHTVPSSPNMTHLITGGVAPANAAYARVSVVSFGYTTSDTMKVQRAIFERGSGGDYFDGDTNTGGLTDFRWSGNAYSSYSHYTLNYQWAITRLQTLLTDWIPLGRTFVLRPNAVPD